MMVEHFFSLAQFNIILAVSLCKETSRVTYDEKIAVFRSLFTKILVGKFGAPFLIMLIGGKLSESIVAANSNCDELIISSVAMALVSPVEGNPLMIKPS
jgi:hypothetical protein